MSNAVAFSTNQASEATITAHLRACDGAFIPSLSNRVDIDRYAHKIFDKAQRFEAWANSELVGLMAAYCNSPNQDMVFVTSVSVLSEWQGRGIASRLVESCIGKVHELRRFARIELEVNGGNSTAILLYEKYGFIAIDKPGAILKMTLDMNNPAPRSEVSEER